MLYDISGKLVVFQRNDFDAPNVTYRDTIQLNTGCYLFHLKDSDGMMDLIFLLMMTVPVIANWTEYRDLDFENFPRDFGKKRFCIISHGIPIS